MAKFCKECGAELADGAAFCKECGKPVAGAVKKSTNNAKNSDEGLISKFKAFSTAKKAIIIILLIVIVIILLAAIGSMGTTTTEPTLSVTNLAITSEGYGAYDISGDLVASQDYDYLEMVVVYYDANGAVLGQDPLVWNMNNVKAGQTVKMSGYGYVSSGTPTRAEVYIFDSAFSGDDLSSAIYSQNVTM
ncbi:MAG: zinc ribbon domain-containing protein [Methanobacteriaceae archaeon]|nr:zinc ribbon domain-containing protein [Methanobacteriaceae archaeon]